MPEAPHTSPATTMDTRKLRVPTEDGGILCQPAIHEAAGTVAENQVRLESVSSLELQGRTLQQMREMTRSELLARSFRYTSEIHPSLRPLSETGPLIVTGHQPQLFHPGVWVKNFAAAGVARRVQGTAVNLIVDNDFCDSASVLVPTQSDRGIRFTRVELEARRVGQPWEERRISDSESLRSFPKRIREKLAKWNVGQSLVDELDFGSATNGARLADMMTAIRSRAEASRGVTNLELPISLMCQTESFSRFLCHLLVNIRQFHNIHNSAIIDYRRRNNLRSKTHPVPELESREGWWEAPFWSWREGESVRRRLFARQLDPDTLAISDGQRTIAELPVGPGKDACCAAEVLMQLASAGERVRTRALTTTIFVRLMFADLFIHGIGGAKYDEMTDVILSQFYRVQPPGFMTVSATLRLLGDRASSVTPAELEERQRQLRRLRFDAQNIVSEEDPEAGHLVVEKRRLIAEQAGDNEPGQRSQERYRRFRRINRELSRHTLSEQRQIEEEIEDLRFQLTQDQMLRSRDLSMCLYPADRLWALLDQVLT